MMLTLILTADEVAYLEGLAGRRKWALAWAIHKVLEDRIAATKLAGVEPEPMYPEP